ncbi:MAG: hypothetical protein V3T10_01725 [Candidatus Bathyarchaeia archaeon]
MINMQRFKSSFGKRTKLALVLIALALAIAGVTTIIRLSEAEQPGSENQSCSYEMDFHLRAQRALDYRTGAAFSNPASPMP